MKINSRRKFLFNSLAITSMPFLHNDVYGNIFKKDKLDLALQIYSFAPLIFQNQLDILDYPELIKNKYNISAAEYWSIAFMGKEKDKNFIRDLNNRTEDQDIRNLIILVDNIDLKTMANGPSLASTVKIERDEAINFHKNWIDTASSLGCHSISVLLRSEEPESKKPKLKYGQSFFLFSKTR